MTPCTNINLHENRCHHHFNLSAGWWRVVSVDGCEVLCCQDCFLSTPKYDVVLIAMLDQDGIPFERRAWTQVDAAANLGREMLR
jgi:hypothetical protein